MKQIVLNIGGENETSNQPIPVKASYVIDPVEPAEATHYVATHPDGRVHGLVQDNVGDRQIVAAMVANWILANLEVRRMTEKELAKHRRMLTRVAGEQTSGASAATGVTGVDPAAPASPGVASSAE